MPTRRRYGSYIILSRQKKTGKAGNPCRFVPPPLASSSEACLRVAVKVVAQEPSERIPEPPLRRCGHGSAPSGAHKAVGNSLTAPDNHDAHTSPGHFPAFFAESANNCNAATRIASELVSTASLVPPDAQPGLELRNSVSTA